MTSKITQQYVGDFSKRTFGGINDCYGITVHETANKADGATAQAHANLQSRYGVSGSWHAQADDLGVIESYRDTDQCWHAGDGRGTGNLRTLAIEICVNLDESRDKQIEAYKSAAYWVATKMVKHSIPLSRVFQHNKFSTFNKNCPTLLREGKYWTWNDFIAQVAVYVAEMKGIEVTSPPVTTPTRPVAKNNTDGGKLDVDGWWGKNVTYDIQSALGTPRDKVVSKQSNRWDDKNPGLTSGWEWVDPQSATGSTVIRAFYDFLVRNGIHTSVLGTRDGLIGTKFIKGLQEWLRKIGYYHGSIDGEIWRESNTVKGLQRALNDGKVK